MAEIRQRARDCGFAAMQSRCNTHVIGNVLNGDPPADHYPRHFSVIDFIRSPLQFVRPMTENEWHDLVARESRREIQRVKRRDAHKTRSASITSQRMAERSPSQVVGSSVRC